MRVKGIDFTSSPSSRKPITVAGCSFDGAVLRLSETYDLMSEHDFKAELGSEGPWIAGIDFPFGLPRKFLENTSNASVWADYVEQFGHLTRKQWRELLDEYKAPRQAGDKEHLRAVDRIAGGVSPQKQYGVPVGLMFHFGAPALREASVSIPPLREIDGESRIVIEAYPGVLVRSFVGRASYKNDSKRKQTEQLRKVRKQIITALLDQSFAKKFGFSLELANAEQALIDDATGDRLDAVLCAIQAAWAWSKRDQRFGCPANVDTLEGWIPDPAVSGVGC